MGIENHGTAYPDEVSFCVIGCSAGGIAALSELFSKLQGDLGFAYVIGLHLPLDPPSMLHEVLAGFTALPVIPVSETVEAAADHVYVITAGRELVIEGVFIKARAIRVENGLRSPIDTLFRSLAVERGDGIAVVLTGAGEDGARGVRAIKEAGGLVLVQDPVEAEYASMPSSAIGSASADFIGSLPAIADKVADIAHSRRVMRASSEEEAHDEVRKILGLTRKRTGYDFSGYKTATVLRRVRRRMQLSRHASFAAYAAHVRDDPAESELLFADLLISVTAFFRDAASFDALQQGIIGPLVAAAEDEVRVWVAGCASGEEAYSIAILFDEEITKRQSGLPVQVFASDLDDEGLATARAGLYPRSIEVDVSAERLKRYFIDEGSHYRVRPELRDMILFAKHSLVRDPPFTRIDLAVCRNVMIYFERPLQQQVAAIFHYALQPRGQLFLGPAEMPDPSSGLFEVVDREHRIYRAGTRPVTKLPVFSRSFTGLEALQADKRRPVPRRASVGALLETAHADSLEQGAPPSVLVDDGRRVLNLSARAGRFMLLPRGPIADSLPAIVRPELRGELLMALDRVFAGETSVVARAVVVAFEDERRAVILHVALVPPAEGAARRALVCFLDCGAAGQATEDSADGNPQQEEVLRLRADLGAAQQALLLSRSDKEAAVQDLRVANEELHSLNEEYRSTAEELETSREELESVNEELYTVNVELRAKVQAISRAHNDLLNLTSSSEIGTLFLDADLIIRMFTPPISTLFKVSSVDVGRNITDFAHRLVYADLERDARAVLDNSQPVEREIRGSNGRWLLLRIRPYLTTENKMNGVVVTFNDVTTRKQEVAYAESEARYRLYVTASFDIVYRMSADWREMLGLEGREVLATTSEPSRAWMDTYILAEDRAHIQALVDAAIRDKTVFEAEHRVLRIDGSFGWTRSRAVPILDDEGAITEWFGTAIDVSDQHAGS